MGTLENTHDTFKMRNLSLLGIEFDINGQKVVIDDIASLLEISDNINAYCYFRDKIDEFLDLQDALRGDLTNYLQECVVEKDGNYYYDFQIDFAYIFGDINAEDQFDNTMSVEKVEEEFKKYFKFDDLFFDSETETVHVLSTTYNSIETFANFFLDFWLTPFLNDLTEKTLEEIGYEG